jgi:3-hydroxyacyl-CoA dehydrogenase/3-hydroxy-2-methylbutyryl-CoA dehydrogenase
VNLESSAVVVTGASAGLGAAVARLVLDGGGSAALLDRQPPTEALASSERAAFFAVDIRNGDEVERAVEAAAAHLGRIDVLVSSAGVAPVARTLDAHGAMASLEQFRRAVEINLIGLYDVVRHCARHMAANPPGADGERGVIVNIASIAAFEGPAGQAAYAASKGGVAALTLPLARDLAPFGVRVVAIAPGFMDTAMVNAAPQDRVDFMRATSVFPKRLGRPEELADLVRAVVANPMINGEVIRLDAATRLPANVVVGPSE